MPLGHARRSICALVFGALASAALGVAACSSREAETSAAQQDGSTPAAPAEGSTPKEDVPAEACPTAVPGTSVEARDVEGGAVLEVTTTGDVAAVRARARVYAEHHGMPSHEHERMYGGEYRSAPTGATGPATPRPKMHGGVHGMAGVQASVQDIDGGARIVLAPRGGGDRDEVAVVRAHARRIAERMASGRCPKMLM